MLSGYSVRLLREVYDWTLSDMDVHNLNEQKYMLCKKIAEVPPSSFCLCLDTNQRSLETASAVS